MVGCVLPTWLPLLTQIINATRCLASKQLFSHAINNTVKQLHVEYVNTNHKNFNVKDRLFFHKIYLFIVFSCICLIIIHVYCA